MKNIKMAGIDFNKAALEIRERFALTKAGQAGLLQRVRALPGISGCVLISTCNRMELWVHALGEPVLDPYEILCSQFQVAPEAYRRYFTPRDGEDAVQHLFELACGLKSLIFGEEQILAQVKEAIADARALGVTDPVLEAVFRRAVTAAKKAKTQVRLTSVDRSAAKTAVALLKEKCETLAELPCLVIGSGEMGRLTAKALVAAGCRVTMTLRQYHSGEAIVPAGCRVIDYEQRYSLLKESKVIVSATRSPHFTLLYDEVKGYFGSEEKYLFDLAVPRDIDPKIAGLPKVTLYDIDHLGGTLTDADNSGVALVREIIREEIEEFRRWCCVRALMPKINEISTAASEDLDGRLQSSLKSLTLDEDCTKVIHEAAGKAVAKVVENILLSLQKNSGAELLEGFLKTAPVPQTVEPASALPPRFPLFVDLSGKSIAVIGAGPVALRRIQTLLAYPCHIKVTAPVVHPDVERLYREDRITLVQKPYEASDIKDAFFVIAATDDRALNHQIALDARRNGQHCSIADCKEECTFYFPATVHYDGGVIGICGTGENHSRTKEMSAGIREFIKAKEQP
jgi:glutamyl-tRNA reductase